MPAREATCSCGQLRVAVDGDPRRVSVCHCVACQRRTGSAFAYQARFDRGHARITGRSHEYTRVSDDGEERWTFHFCPDCGATVYYDGAGDTELIAIPVGGFADPGFPAPTVSVWGSRKHEWVDLPTAIEQY